MKSKTNAEFGTFRAKVTLLAAAAFLLAVAVFYTLYSLLSHGYAANVMVAAMQTLLGLDYESALEMYQKVFRQHRDLFLVLAAAGGAAACFRLFLDWLTGYLAAIARGLERLTQEDEGEISLPPGLFGIERRMNALKHALQQQKNKMKTDGQRKNDLVMYLAHDLKTPLASAVGYLHLLQDETQISRELQKRYTAIALEKAERLEDLINEFFEIAKFSLSDITLEYGRINLTRLLEQLIYEFEPLLRQKGLRCALLMEADVPLRCDAGKLERVFDNLLRNAALYSFPDTEIRIEAAREEDSLTVTFLNRGDPIPEEKRERVFEQFYRLDAGRSAATGGAGLGLAIAKQIVTLHGGTITVKSEGEETAFAVTLPL